MFAHMHTETACTHSGFHTLMRTQARDAFYECVKEQGLVFSPDQKVPSKCKGARAAYEKSCPSSWVSARSSVCWLRANACTHA